MYNILEPYYHWELNPHAPKLNDTVLSNDIMTPWYLNPSQNSPIELIRVNIISLTHPHCRIQTYYEFILR
ncbi:hypothetical protein NMY3_00339 [Candidatus Nitrosocosmicus oleophilus]|uniref:Uncharacterized protein n=1 Tax=Candidatus Nitrosocosmicus oleophilus TaxID=1353260 RepID=A0A654LW54_9ARCH|nr:hypothetical protein NMY3_00339 [Candidatus Nitrosocosmicus oleophilus]